MAGSFRTWNSGSRNTAIGTEVLQGNDSGNNNTAVGHEAMVGVQISDDELVQDGSNNTALGTKTLRNNLSGDANTAAGFESLFSNETGDNNTATGSKALRALTTGARNVALGHQAGAALTTGNDNIIIGSSNTGVAGDSGVIRIGKSTSQKKTYIAGIRGVTTGSINASAVFVDANGQLGTIKSSREVKEDIGPIGGVSERLLSLRPVTFHYKQADDDGSKPIQYGLIAEEVAETFPELVVYDANGKPETVAYHLLPTLLLNELQKEHRMNEQHAEKLALQQEQLETQASQLAEVDALKQQLAEVREILAALQSGTTRLQVAKR